MKESNNKKTYDINEYLLKKLNNYKKNKLDLNVILGEKRQKINQIEKNINVLSQQQKLDDSSELFKPFHSLMTNKSEIDKLVEMSVLLKKECKILEKNIDNTNNEIDEISHVIDEMLRNKNLSNMNSHNILNNYNILRSQENENQRISRDLHDSVVQNLTSYIYKIELIQKFIEIDPNRCRLEVELLRVNIKKTINELRNIIYNLRPMSFDDFGIKDTLENVINQIQVNNDVKIVYKVVENDRFKFNDVDPIISISLLRIIQEASSNSIRHGLATNIDISVIINDTYIQMNIIDDGKGFNATRISNREKNNKSGYGINIMKERVFLLHGNIDISSENDKGTKIVIDIPLYNYAENEPHLLNDKGE